jgi:RimJ/RimL family protein N-acetyltransferase
MHPEALIDAVVAEHPMAVVVVECARENSKARAAYLKHGFNLDGDAQPYPIGDAEVPMVRYSRPSTMRNSPDATSDMTS